jgi:formyltetrahydrofolate hydrolase
VKANYGGLDVDIAAVIGNHDTLRPLVERFGIPFEPEAVGLFRHQNHHPAAACRIEFTNRAFRQGAVQIAIC